MNKVSGLFRRVVCFTLLGGMLASCSGRHAGQVLPPSSGSTINGTSGTSASRSVFAATLSEKHFADQGEIGADENIHLLISLAHRNEADLEQLIKDQETPGSPSYLHFLTPQQFDERFGALPATRNRIKAVLRAAGFQVDNDRFGASVIEADGPAAKAESLFAIKIHSVREGSGRVAHMPTSSPVTPASLQNDVVSILGLDNTDIVTNIDPSVTSPDTICPQSVSPGVVTCCNGVCPTPIPRPSLTPRPTPAPTPVPGSQYPGTGPGQPIGVVPGYTDDTTYNPNWGYALYTYAHDFDLPVQHGFAGSSQFPIGIVAAADVSDNDLNQFYSDMQVNRTGSLIRVGAGGTSYNWPTEATIDVETVSGLAPSATVYLYMQPDMAPNDVTAAMNVVVQQNAVAVASISYGFCENQGYPALYESASGVDDAASQASAQGITFVSATGDAGGPSNLSGCSSINAPAASSYVVAVGGLSPDAPDNNESTPGIYGYQPGHQYAWGQPYSGGSPCAQNFCGSGGGASTHFQTPEQLGACGGSGTTWRCVPDISLPADAYHRGFLVFQGSAYAGAAGTSFAAPMFAAVQAEIDQRQGTRKGNVVGRLYSTWSTYGYNPFASGQPPAFYDITAGNNGYAAGSSYDWASGIGSIDGWALSSLE